VWTLQYFQKKLDLFLAHENMKKTPTKVDHNRPKIFFSVLAWLPKPVCSEMTFGAI
jgi:hypothetical protein